MSGAGESIVKMAHGIEAAAPKQRKKGGTDRSEYQKVAILSQPLDMSEMMQRNHGNGIASRSAGFSIDNILSPNSQGADLSTSPRPTVPAEKPMSDPLPSPDPHSEDEKPKNLAPKNFDDEKEMETIEIGAKTMPVDKWYNTLLWQQHQQQYQQHISATPSAFYHPYHLPFSKHVSHNVTNSQTHQPPSGFPPVVCPAIPGRVHPFTCHCAAAGQLSDQPYFLLTPAGYSIPSPFQSDPYFASHRYCRRRKARTVFNDYQIKGLEARFVHQQYLSTHERVDLANLLCLTEGQVKTWFQNRRMKEKKLFRDQDHQSDDKDDELNLDVEPLNGDDSDDKSEVKKENDVIIKK